MKRDDAKNVKEWKKALAHERRHGFDVYSAKDRAHAEIVAEDYRRYVSEVKTERESTRWLQARAASSGFAASPGAFATTYRNKVAAMARFGSAPLREGLTIVAAHHDSPRLDVKINPLYEELQYALLKTHYYGGVRKHQWVARPLALHGVVMLADGRSVDVSIGEDADDPVFTIADLLPHLAAKVQGEKKLSEAIPAEKLNLIVGGYPLGGEEDKDRFKLAALRLLNQRFGMVEEDFISAELEIVPAGPARYVGLDRAFIGAYGHDDRVCTYAAARALWDAKPSARTQLVIAFDKEEIGSFGNTAAQGFVLEHLVERLFETRGESLADRAVEKALHESVVISADVGACMDPDWKDVHDRRNAAFAGHGLVIKKYTGQRGKSQASDASAELVFRLRQILNAEGLPWQSATMGKVDEGGGGTVAKFLATRGAEVIDAGPPVLGMHSPFELVHVLDVYSAYRSYKTFLERL